MNRLVESSRTGGQVKEDVAASSLTGFRSELKRFLAALGGR